MSAKACHNFGAQSSIHGVFSDFSQIVSDKLETNSLKNAQSLFDYIESVVLNGGEDSNAACTCFLENILNRTPSSIEPSTFVPYLGPESKKFCKAWDEFTGVATNGL